MNVERGTRRIIQHRHIEPRYGASVSHLDAGTVGCRAATGKPGFKEVVFADVFVPDDHVMGEIDGACP